MRQEELWDKFYSKNRTAWRGNTTVPIRVTGKALDLGCGNGKTVSTLIDEGFEVTGIDFSEIAVQQCRERFPQAELVVGSVTDLPFPNSSFDYITAVHVLEHLDDKQLSDTVDEVSRVLREGGFVFIRNFTERDMRSEKRSDSDISYRFYEVQDIVDAFKGFSVISAELKEERTRFGTLRSRAEVLLKL